MNLTDLEGKIIQVTDLNSAIEQVEIFRNMKHIDPEFASLDDYLHNYWEDVYQKLLVLKTAP